MTNEKMDQLLAELTGLPIDDTYHDEYMPVTADDLRALIRIAIEDEREECAKLAWDRGNHDLSHAIRNRKEASHGEEA